MAKTNKKPDKKAELSNYQSMKDKVEDLINGEYIPWREELKKYWPGIDRNQDAWEFYKSEKEKSPSKVSLNTPFAIIESMVAKSNEANMKVSAEAKGFNGLEEVQEYIAATVEGAINDRDIELLYGPFRKRREIHFREYLVKGTAFSEDQYVYKTQIVNGVKKVIADNPMTEPLDYKTVVFNPAYQADNSPVYWVEKHTTWDKLKEQEYDEKTGKGLYKNLGTLKENCDKSGKLIDHNDLKVMQDGKKKSQKVEPIELLIRWEGPKMLVVADKNVIIREANDPFKIGRHNLHISMNYKAIGRPYAYGEIDAIYKPVRAQDTILNQNITAINKYLEPAMTYDPNDLSINLDQIMDVLENGGVAPAKKDSIVPINRVLPPTQAFTTIESLQQSIERAARYSPYSAGVANSQTDKTQGTATGINSLIQAAEPNFQIKLDDLRDTYYTPIASNYLTMIAALMGKDDIRHSKLMGKKPMWVQATKNLLLGKLNIEELRKAEVIDEQAYQEFITEELPDEMTGEMVAVQNPELAKEVLFDVDWLVNVTLDNQAENDKLEKTQKKQEWFQACIQMGLPMDAKKFMLDMGEETGIEDAEQYVKDEQTVQQEQEMEMQQQQGEQQAQQEAEMQKEQMKHQMGMEAKQAEFAAKQGMTEAQIQAQMQMAQMKQQPMQGGM